MMYIISSFEHSLYLELAISKLEESGIKREKILAVPLDKRAERKRIFDTSSQSDGISLFDGATIVGTAFMVLGVIYGYVWKWGPIIWGLIGLILGSLMGLILDLFGRKLKPKKRPPSNKTEVIMIVNCDKNQADLIESVLWDHFAFGVGRMNR